MSQDPYTRKVLLSTNRKPDLDIHVSRVSVDDQTYVDLREFIPSLQAYGRGLLIPVSKAREIGKAIFDEGPDGDAD